METSRSTVRSGGLLAVLAFAGIVASLTQTLVVPLLGQLPQLLHTEASNAAWVVTSSLLVSAVVTPVAGRLGDMFGKRLVLVGSVVPVVIGSVVCALASSLWPMIIGRGLQGMGVGLIPVGIAALRDLLPPRRLGSGIALISSSLGIGGALGMPLAAAVVEYSSWRVLFWGVAALSALSGLLIFAVVPRVEKHGPRGRFDVLGALGLGTALVCLLLAVSKGATWGWTSPTISSLFGGTVVALVVWAWWELRIRDPLVDLRVTVRPQVLLTNAASIVLGMAMYAQVLLVPQLLQLPATTGYGLGQSMVQMGLWMAPGGLMMTLISPIGARLSARSGPKVTLATGAVIITAGYGCSLFLMGTTWGLLAVTVIISIGVGFAYGAMPALIMGAVPASETAAANSFNTLMRAIGTSVAAAVIGAALAELSTTVQGHSIPTENGFRVGLLIGCGVAAAAALIALTIPVRRAVVDAADGVDDHGAGEVAPARVGKAVPIDNADAQAAEPGSDSRPLVSTSNGAVSPLAPAVASSASDTHAEPDRVPADAGPLDTDRPAGWVVFGRVQDARGAAVTGATLTLISTSGRQMGRTRSRADGYYELAAPTPDSYVLIASAEGRRPDASTVTLGGLPVTCDVTLDAMAGITGTVARSDNGSPVPGARIAVLDLRGEVLSSGETDPAGRFEVGELLEGEFTVAVSALGFHPTAVPARVSGRDTAVLDVLLRPGVRLRGVVRTRDGRPLEDAQVTLTDARGEVVDTLTTGPDGAYTFANLDAGTYTVIATGYGPETAQVRVHDEDITGVDVELGHRPSVLSVVDNVDLAARPENRRQSGTHF